MNRRQLIERIFNRVPSNQAGFNTKGEHVVEFEHNNMLVRANLEQLSIGKLSSLARNLITEVEPA